MSSLGTTNSDGIGIVSLVIKNLTKPISKINPARVFEKGRVIYGTDNSTPGIITSIKVGDKVTQYQNLKELIASGTVNGINGLTATPVGGSVNIGLGGTLSSSTQINFSSLHPLSFVDLASGSTVSINTSGFSAAYNVGNQTTQIISGTDQTLMQLATLGNNTGISMDYTNGIKVYDDIFAKGFIYKADYSTNGSSNPRWIPDIGYISSHFIATGGGTTTGPAGGDLAGTYPNPTIKSSVALGGNPTTANLPTTADNTGSLASTAWVQSVFAATETFFVPGLFVGSIDPVTPTPGSTGNPYSLGTHVIDYTNLTLALQAIIDGKVSISAPQLTTGSTVGYIWTASDTAGHGNWAVAPVGVTPANPSASIGLVVINGSAGTFMRSDAAPALSQSITPTWTGLHTFSTTNTASTVGTTANYGTYIAHTVNQTSVANFTDLVVNRVSNTPGSGTQNLLDLQVAGSSKLSVSSSGYLTAGTGATLGATQIQLFNRNSTPTVVDGAFLWNTASATSGATLATGPTVRWQGSVWNSSGTPAANYFGFRNYATAVSSGAPTSTLSWDTYLGTSTTPTWTNVMNLDISGNLVLSGAITATTATQTAHDNSTKLASTAYVDAAVTAALSVLSSKTLIASYQSII